jgi:magnesium transporter
MSVPSLFRREGMLMSESNSHPLPSSWMNSWLRNASPRPTPGFGFGFTSCLPVATSPRRANTTPVEPPTHESSMEHAALYLDGVRVGTPATLAGTFRQLRRQRGGMAWIDLHRPSEAELVTLAEEFTLHPLAIEDALEAHQRPKLEQFDNTLFLVLRPARYRDGTEDIDFGELHIFAGPDFVITVRHGAAPDLSSVRRRMEDTQDLLALGPDAVLYAILDAVLDGYAPVVAGVQHDIDEIETEVFHGASDVSRRIYQLARKTVEFQHATRPLVGMLDELMAEFAMRGVDEELQRYLRDVADHVSQTSERVDGFHLALTDVLTVNSTLVGQEQTTEMSMLAKASLRQSEETKKISAWAAVLLAPTLVGAIYGMNFENIPELHWVFGYPFAISLMAVISGGIYVAFKRRNCL